jgi:hypothetical protein
MNKKTFAYLLLAGAVLWALSILVMYGFFPAPATVQDFGDMFGAVNALFSGLALAGVIYAVLVQTEEIKNNQIQIEKSIRANEISARLAAYSALLQEGDSALERYERWEQRGNGHDYSNVKAKVRDNVKTYRTEIEKLVSQLQG